MRVCVEDANAQCKATHCRELGAWLVLGGKDAAALIRAGVYGCVLFGVVRCLMMGS